MLRVPPNARVTIKTAVQKGRAIGATVTVRFERPKSAKPLSKAAAKAELKRSTAIVACVDRAVRVLVWPPSSRRGLSSPPNTEVLQLFVASSALSAIPCAVDVQAP